MIVNYDDSDGFYDHVYPGVVNPSLSPADNLTNTTLGAISAANPTSQQCGPKPQTSAPLGGQQGRCGFGPRQPFLLISPWAKQNAVDNNLSDLASVPNLIEYNWHLTGIPGSFDQALSAKDASEGVPFDLAGLFDFSRQLPAIQLNPATGQIDLANATLNGQSLKGANLSGADLSNSTLQGVNLQGAFLENANLTGANLHGVNLEGADLTGANLTGATLTGANTNNVTWSNTTCPDGSSSNADGGTCKGHL